MVFLILAETWSFLSPATETQILIDDNSDPTVLIAFCKFEMNEI